MTRKNWDNIIAVAASANKKGKDSNIVLYPTAAKFFKKLNEYHLNRVERHQSFWIHTNKSCKLNTTGVSFEYSWNNPAYNISHFERVTIPWNYIMDITGYGR